MILLVYWSRDSAVATATVYEPDDRGVGREISFLHIDQTGSGTHPASYPMRMGGAFPEGKAAGAWSWPLASNYYRSKNTWIYTPTPPYTFME
jgi:hypothetical protein